ncbi:hypothetical protein BGZ46_002049 [Entomortierella lignicola]|nr:hypothetical protein BGZ46_002049 [Entomortierella lignicola]
MVSVLQDPTSLQHVFKIYCQLFEATDFNRKTLDAINFYFLVYSSSPQASMRREGKRERVKSEKKFKDTYAAPRVEVDDEVESDPEGEEEEDEIIDHTTFDQLLEMDDEDEQFSRSLVLNYFEQAEETFKALNKAMSQLEFPELTRLGHFLKGSSAALGLIKIRESCEKLQHYGNRKDAEGAETITDSEAEILIRALLDQMRQEYDEAKSCLESFYERE